MIPTLVTYQAPVPHQQTPRAQLRVFLLKVLFMGDIQANKTAVFGRLT